MSSRKRSAYMKECREKLKRRKLSSDVLEAKVNTTNAERCKKYRQKLSRQHQQTTKLVWLQKYLRTEFYENLLDAICDVCDRIWFRSDVICTNIDAYSILNEIGKEKFNKTNITICRTCLSSVRKNEVPRLATIHGFKFVDIPAHLPELDPIVERLISPRLPFMRLIHLRYSPGSCKIQGQVINVPVDVDEIVRSLPRNLDDDVTFNVSIKRNLLHESIYLSGCVKKRDVFLWLQALSQTELYKENNIEIQYQDIEDQYSNDDEKIFEYRRKLLDKLEDDGTGEGLMSTYQETFFWSEDMVLNIAPGQHNTPIPLCYDLDAEELSFPVVYFGTRRKFSYAVSPFQVMTSEIKRSDRRAVKQNHILYKATKLLRSRFTAGLQRVFKRGGDEYQTLTRDDLENNERIRDFMERDLAFFRTIPNSIQYWQMKKSDLFAMIRQLGKPTIFLTLSASEIYWPELMRLLYKYRYPDQEESSFDFENSSVAMRTLMVNEDPVIVCLYFDKLIDTIMRALATKTNGSFGQHHVIDYFKRVEFQHRGSPHVHMLLWLHNAPNEAVSEDMPQKIALINSLMTTNINELFSERTSIQVHRHTHTCYKNNRKKCRFGIPFWPMQETRILLPVKEQDLLMKNRFTSIHSNLSSQQDLYHTFEDFLKHNDIWSGDEYFEILRHGIDRPTVFLKRDVHDCFVNPFNPAISAIIDSNMDIQYILDEYSCAAYVAEYVNKSNRGFSSLHRELIALRNQFPNMDYDNCLKEVEKKCLANIEMCSQEAAWILLRLEMSRASR